ncbi:hypothetical protein [Streptomyces coelicoflavus]|uniref:hypothetical protein n=1 Tax=Streptomyces coelicoflavus TaxID=285562 RepID=UPI0013927544|nr:hypothetical protein [Streptomyces sp. SID5926]
MAQTLPAGQGGAANGYTALVVKFTALQKAANGLLDEVEFLAQRMRRNADAATTVADLSAAAHVDPAHVAAIADVGNAFAQAVGGCKRLMSAADTMHTAAGHLRHEHQAEYGAIHAAVTASRARQAKPGFYRQT